MINVLRTTFNEDMQPIKTVYTVKINGDVPASHRMVQSENNAIFEHEEQMKNEFIRKKKNAKAIKEAKKKAAKIDKIVAQKESTIEEGKKTNPTKQKKFYHKKKVNNYVRHQ